MTAQHSGIEPNLPFGWRLIQARFSAAVRDEVDVECLIGELTDVVQMPMQSSEVRVWSAKTESRQ